MVSDSGQNLRINVATGETITDGDINGATPAATVIATAYTCSFGGTMSTALFDLDSEADRLYSQVPPNDGTLVNPRPLGIDLVGQTGFDIAGGDAGLALAAVTPTQDGPSLLYGVPLSTSAATLYRNASGTSAASQIGGAAGPTVIDLAIRI